MGYERKRGKLADLNAMLRGAAGSFRGSRRRDRDPAGVRYVITLDTDTQLPRDAARLMVGTLAHPLNRPVFDARCRRVVDGYTILQPRVGVSLPSAQRSRFVQLYAGDPGVDPYTRVVSDVYQDLFGEGSFIGKGIYDVDSFEHRCGDFPENAILSHDLIEGAYCRSALLSDVTLYEEHPSRYAADIARRHRWMRGDWQIAAWLLPWVRGRSGQRVRNPISALSRWKIFDNLRRSLVPVAMLLVLLDRLVRVAGHGGGRAGLLGERGPAADAVRRGVGPASQAGGLAVAHASARDAAVVGTAAGPKRVDVRLLAVRSVHQRRRDRAHAGAHGLDQRRLLEWKTASDSERGANGSLTNTFRAMAVAPALAAASCVALAVVPSRGVALRGALARRLDGVAAGRLVAEPADSQACAATLQEPAAFPRKAVAEDWRYFEEFVTAEDNWLPPDNIQQNPGLVVAPRTSPTNIGMALLADLAAYDFGYCLRRAVSGAHAAHFDTLSRMERYRGHFFNWYDTRSLAPLHPRYVSMVDSGNLAANLLVLGSGCVELSEAPVLPPRMFGGLRDTLRVLLDVARGTRAAAGRRRRAAQDRTPDRRSRASSLRRWAPPTPCSRG